jgi:hypothetical protein
MNDRVYETRPGRKKKPAPLSQPAPKPVEPEPIEDIDMPVDPELVNEAPVHHEHKKAKAHRHGN